MTAPDPLHAEGAPGAVPPAPLPPGALERVSARLASGAAIATLNYHSTPAHRREAFAAQLRRLAGRFDPLTEPALDAVAEGWRPPRPLLMPVLFEGFRDNLDVILPLLEEAGLTAWLVIPPGFLDVDPEDQRAYAAANRLIFPGGGEPGDRIAMTWDELGAVAERGHVVGCHSRDHAPLSSETPGAVLEWQIAAGRALMERRLGLSPRLFCWRRGAGVGLNPRADAVLRREGFRHLLTTLSLQRLA